MNSFFQFTTAGSLRLHGRDTVPHCTPRTYAKSWPTFCPSSASRSHTPTSVSFLCSLPFTYLQSNSKVTWPIAKTETQPQSWSPHILGSRKASHSPGIHVHTPGLRVTSVLDIPFLGNCTRRHCRASEGTTSKVAIKRKTQG